MKAKDAIRWLERYHDDKELMIMWADAIHWEVDTDVWTLACKIFDESSNNYHFNTEVAEMIALAKKELAEQTIAEDREGAIDVYLAQLAEEQEQL